MTDRDHAYYERAARLRGHLFELLDELGPPRRTGHEPLECAALHLQEAANRLGQVESLLARRLRAAA